MIICAHCKEGGAFGVDHYCPEVPRDTATNTASHYIGAPWTVGLGNDVPSGWHIQMMKLEAEAALNKLALRSPYVEPDDQALSAPISKEEVSSFTAVHTDRSTLNVLVAPEQTEVSPVDHYEIEVRYGVIPPQY